MRLTQCKGVPVLALLVVLGGCADAVSRTVAPPASKDVAAESGSQVTEERAALTEIARLIAQSMDNEPARQHLKRDMRAAPFREHKLELTSYLASKDGRALLDRMAALDGGEQRVLGTLSKIRPLEFYVPVAAQRETWTGKADVLVEVAGFEPACSGDHLGLLRAQPAYGSHVGVSTGGRPLGQPGCDVPRWPPGGALAVSLLSDARTPTAGTRDGRLPRD